MQLTEAIGDRELQAKLLETTYKYVRILLRSERVRTHSGERSLLKNLGSWLGRLTIARSKPVRHRCAPPDHLPQCLLEYCRATRTTPCHLPQWFLGFCRSCA